MFGGALRGPGSKCLEDAQPRCRSEDTRFLSEEMAYQFFEVEVEDGKLAAENSADEYDCSQKASASTTSPCLKKPAVSET